MRYRGGVEPGIKQVPEDISRLSNEDISSIVEKLLHVKKTIPMNSLELSKEVLIPIIRMARPNKAMTQHFRRDTRTMIAQLRQEIKNRLMSEQTDLDKILLKKLNSAMQNHFNEALPTDEIWPLDYNVSNTPKKLQEIARRHSTTLDKPVEQLIDEFENMGKPARSQLEEKYDEDTNTMAPQIVENIVDKADEDMARQIVENLADKAVDKSQLDEKKRRIIDKERELYGPKKEIPPVVSTGTMLQARPYVPGPDATPAQREQSKFVDSITQTILDPLKSIAQQVTELTSKFHEMEKKIPTQSTALLNSTLKKTTPKKLTKKEQKELGKQDKPDCKLIPSTLKTVKKLSR